MSLICNYRSLGLQPYQHVWQAMRDFTISRSTNTHDEIWSCEHFPVYTQGQAGKAEHILSKTQIPIIQSDRGGQVTYHGPGQLLIYVMFDLKRLALTVRGLVCALEQSLISSLASYDIEAYAKREAPGVYVDGAKVCSLGLRIKRGCSYHGMAVNVDMDLSPFNNINPCGFKQLPISRLIDLAPNITVSSVKLQLLTHIAKRFDFRLHSLEENHIGTVA